MVVPVWGVNALNPRTDAQIVYAEKQKLVKTHSTIIYKKIGPFHHHHILSRKVSSHRHHRKFPMLNQNQMTMRSQ